MDERKRFVQFLQRNFGNLELAAIGDVCTVITITTPTVTVRPGLTDSADDTHDIPGVFYLASYVPAVGDLVQVLTISGSPYILGKLGGVAIPHSEGINVAGSANTTTSTTYVDLSATSSFSFTKGYAHTALKLVMNATYFATVADGSARFGVRINSVDYDLGQLFHNQINTHKQVSGWIKIDGGVVPAGTYTVQGRWKRISGTATLTRDTSDWLSIGVTEEWD